jgi:predicted RNase H-like HicB family nuclease
MNRQYTYTIEVHPAEADEKGYWVSVPALPGCFTQGDSYEEAVERAHEAIACYLEGLVERGQSIPVEPVHPSLLGIQVVMPEPA